MQKILLVFSFILFVWGCTTKKNNETVIEKSPLHNWLKKPENLDKKNYRDTFNNAFKKLVSSNKPIEASSLLDAYGNALDLRFEFDSLYIKKCKTFLIEHEKQLDDYHQVALNYFLGSQYDFKNEKDSSDIYLTKTNIETNNKEALKLQGFAGIIAALHYTQKGQHEEALQQCLKNLKLFETLKDSVNIATTYISMVDVYKRLKIYDESLRCNYNGLELALRIKDTSNIWNAYINFARPSEMAINKDTALHYAKKAKALSDMWSVKSDYYSSTSLYNYGLGLLLNNQLDSVAYFFDESKKRCKSTMLKQDLIAGIHLLDQKMNRPNSNIPEVLDAYNQAKANKDNTFIETFAEILADDAYKKGDYKKAFEYNRVKYSTCDSSWTVETRDDVVALERKYQTAKKEKTIAEQKSRISTSKFQITALLFLLLGLSLMAIAYFTYRKRKEAQAEVIRQQKFTDELLQNTEDERKRIATDLHDGVNHELLTLKNQANKGKTINSDEIEKIINEVRQVSRDLYPAMFDNIGLVASIEALCERMTEAGLFTSCEINYTLKLSKRNELQLYRIIQEALNNTLKHAKADAAKVTIDTVENELQVEIKDNGIGFDTIDKMNNASSFGIQSLMQRARAIGGKSTIESNENGTKLILKTPIH